MNFKTLLHALLGAAGAGVLGALGGKSAAIQLLLSILGSAITSALSALAQSTKSQPKS